jgi:SAM-dependent methyltransferase
MPSDPTDRPRSILDAPTGGKLEHFERMYEGGDEPWSFSARGVETLRHERLAAMVRTLVDGRRDARVLDLGCSLGQLTARLATLPAQVVALDLSPTAVSRAREQLRAQSAAQRLPLFAAGSATEIPLARSSFDVVLASDGLYSWQLVPAERAAEIHETLKPGGHVILTEHMRPKRFPEYVGEVRASPLTIVEVTYSGDRPCYQFESWLKGVQGWGPARALRRSVRVARALSAVGRRFGAAGSRHVYVVARRG